jgi:hypothetical protein
MTAEVPIEASARLQSRSGTPFGGDRRGSTNTKCTSVFRVVAWTSEGLRQPINTSRRTGGMRPTATWQSQRAPRLRNNVGTREWWIWALNPLAGAQGLVAV